MILSPLNLSSQQSRGSSARWRKIPVQKNSEETGRRTVLELLKCCCKGVIENLQFYGTFIQTRQDFPLWRLLMQKYCSIVLYQLLTVILVATLHHTDCVFTSLFPIHCRSSLFHHSIGFIHVSISVSHVSKNKMLRFCHSYFPYLQSANTTGHLVFRSPFLQPFKAIFRVWSLYLQLTPCAGGMTCHAPESFTLKSTFSQY